MLYPSTVLALAALLAPAGFGQPQNNSPFGIVSGTVTYLQRMALPPNAVVHVRLEDVSVQDRAADLVADLAFTTAGKQVPLPFEIPYLRSNIADGRHYAVRASIFMNGERRFISTKAYLVLTEGAPNEVEIVVQPVPTSLPLEGTNWKLIDLGGRAPLIQGTMEEPHLLLMADGKKLAGSPGCNRLFGTYTLNGNRLQLRPAGLSVMACPEPIMRQERAFIAALKATTSYRVNGKRLELMHGSKVLARFEPRLTD